MPLFSSHNQMKGKNCVDITPLNDVKMVTKGWVYLFYKNIDKMIDFLDNEKSVHTTQLVDYVSSSLHQFKNTSFKLKHLNNSLTFVTPLNINLIKVHS